MSYQLNIRDILQDLVSQAGISEAELARKINIPSATFNKIKTGRITDPRSSTLTTIANYFGLSVDQLLGYAPIISSTNASLCYVPIIAVDQAQNINVKQLNYSTHKSWISFSPKQALAKHKMLAIKVTGDAMLPYFDQDTIAIVDCDQKPESKHYVLVHIKNSNETLLRQILCDGNMRVLKPINSFFNSITLTAEDVIIGVIIHSIRSHM